jgi:hypothetical protein
MGSKTTYYRRLRRASALGCKVDELPDGRGCHLNHSRGPNHYRWNHNAIYDDRGYKKVRVGRNHSLADPNGYAYEHLIVWISAGNALPKSGELIHHKDENKEDNRIENLELKTKAAHNSLHNAKRGRDVNGRFLPKAAGRLLDGRTWDETPKGSAQ